MKPEAYACSHMALVNQNALMSLCLNNLHETTDDAPYPIRPLFLHHVSFVCTVEPVFKTTWEIGTTWELRIATSVLGLFITLRWTWEIRPPQNSGQFLTVPWVSLILRFHRIYTLPNNHRLFVIQFIQMATITVLQHVKVYRYCIKKTR